jgi:hypothetical protein
MPRAQTRVGELEGVGQLTGPYRTLQAGADRVKLEGELAEFIAEPAYSLSDLNKSNADAPSVVD